MKQSRSGSLQQLRTKLELVARKLNTMCENLNRNLKIWRSCVYLHIILKKLNGLRTLSFRFLNLQRSFITDNKILDMPLFAALIQHSFSRSFKFDLIKTQMHKAHKYYLITSSTLTKTFSNAFNII